MIKSFRGLLQNSEQKRIKLSTNNGLTGYKIHKFMIMPNSPFGDNTEYVVKITTQELATLSADVNLDSPLILAVAAASNSAGWGGNQPDKNIVFDNKKFNQDIYISTKNSSGTDAINYYLELETMPISKDEATVATLRDMRGRE